MAALAEDWVRGLIGEAPTQGIVGDMTAITGNSFIVIVRRICCNHHAEGRQYGIYS